MNYRILFLNWQDIKHPLGGGAEVYHQEIFTRIAAKGHKITQVSSGYHGLENEEYIDGIRIIRSGGRNWFNFAIPAVCRRLFREEAYDVVVDSINKIPLMSPLYIRKVPVIAAVHHLFTSAIFHEVIFPFALYVYLFEKLIRPVYRSVPFIAVSESTKQELVTTGIREENISIIENCVDHEVYRVSSGEKSDVPLVGYLGRIKRYKSVDHLIKAFALVTRSLPDARLVIVGDGDNLSDLKRLVSRLHLEHAVQFTGFVTREEKVKILQECYVVVNPSIKEGWGLTIIEANACGTPTVAADVPGLRDSVRNGSTGLLYPYGDIGKCAEHIVKFLTDPVFRERASGNALRWASQFNWDDAADKTLELIERVVTENKN